MEKEQGFRKKEKKESIDDIRNRIMFEAEDIKIEISNRDNEDRLLTNKNELSNLSELEWKIVRTPSFKNWFGDWEKNPEESSQMLDKNGEPKVFSHRSYLPVRKIEGARKDFSVSSRFMHFTSEWKGSETRSPYGDIEHKVFLNLRKVRKVSGVMEYYDLINYPGKAGFPNNIDEDYLKFLNYHNYDGVYATGNNLDNYSGPLMYTDEIVALNPNKQVLIINKEDDWDQYDEQDHL